MAFLLPSRAVGAASVAVAALLDRLAFGATSAAGGAAGASFCTACQIRLTAVLRSVNFLTGLRSPKGADSGEAIPDLYQPSRRPVGGQLRQILLAYEGHCAQCHRVLGGLGVANAVMLLSVLIVKVVMVVSFLLLVCGAAQAGSPSDANLASGCQVGSVPAAIRRFASDAHLGQYATHLRDVSRSDLYVPFLHGTSIHHSRRYEHQAECSGLAKKDALPEWKAKVRAH